MAVEVRRKPHTSASNKKKHLSFANKYVNKSPQFWKKVIFSEEKKFRIFGIKGHNSWCGEKKYGFNEAKSCAYS